MRLAAGVCNMSETKFASYNPKAATTRSAKDQTLSNTKRTQLFICGRWGVVTSGTIGSVSVFSISSSILSGCCHRGRRSLISRMCIMEKTIDLIRAQMHDNLYKVIFEVFKPITLRSETSHTKSFLAKMHHLSSSSNAKPSILDGPDGVNQLARRIVERFTTQMERYRKHSVFLPSNWWLKDFILFTKLQVPTHTEIDAVDFLHGAQFACDLVIQTMYSKEFLNYATGAISESAAAEKMKLGMSANCFDAFVFAMKQTHKSGNQFTLRQLDINGIHLFDVEWQRMSLAEYKQEQAQEATNRAKIAAMEKDGIVEENEKERIADIHVEDHAVLIERLQLDVVFNAVEHLTIETLEAPDRVTAKKSSAIWRFESLVTQPEDLDWRIVSVS
ncbi:hypothetical protein CCR75_000858 [Bremia lactucae]|uniref:Uncharacterized protein n=1 Tax=Bremia lactucae TaxID=4779 RepID=A0A976IFK3_BRELC|nr:hypothetical protein CCR75_000858 [Bremia lactucae]